MQFIGTLGRQGFYMSLRRRPQIGAANGVNLERQPVRHLVRQRPTLEQVRF